MAFIDAILDEAVAYGFEGGPEYSTDEVILDNGIRHANSAWAYPRHRYNAQYDNMEDEDRARVIEIFHAVRGKRHSFKFKDWNDYQAVNESLNVPASFVGTSNPVQLYKTYTFGPAYAIRPIQALASAVIFLGATAVAGLVDTETGMFTPSTPWVAGSYTWSGEFYVWVHFTNDYNSFTINSWRASTADIEMEEDKRRITAENVPASWEE